MSKIVEKTGDADLVVRSLTPSVPGWLVYLFAAQVGLAVLGLGREASTWRLFVVGFWLLAGLLFLIIRRRDRRRPAGLRLSAEGITFTPTLGRTRTYPWQDVERLDVDPAGGPRFVNVSLRSGRWHRLVAAPEEQVADIKARWRAVQALRAPR